MPLCAPPTFPVENSFSHKLVNACFWGTYNALRKPLWHARRPRCCRRTSESFFVKPWMYSILLLCVRRLVAHWFFLTDFWSQMVRMLLAVVILFAVLWLPYRALLVYNSLAQKPLLNLWYLFFAKSSIFVNSAINPIMYNAMSKKFRSAFRDVVMPCLNSGESSNQKNVLLLRRYWVWWFDVFQRKVGLILNHFQIALA